MHRAAVSRATPSELMGRAQRDARTASCAPPAAGGPVRHGSRSSPLVVPWSPGPHNNAARRLRSLHVRSRLPEDPKGKARPPPGDTNRRAGLCSMGYQGL